jgi:hypothetical protein
MFLSHRLHILFSQWSHELARKIGAAENFENIYRRNSTSSCLERVCHVFKKIKRTERTPKLQNHKNAQLLKMIIPKYIHIIEKILASNWDFLDNATLKHTLNYKLHY